MLEKLKEEISEALHEAKGIEFILAPSLESFARGVEHGLLKALILTNSQPQAHCAGCGEFKETPLKREEMGGYVCLTCIDNRLNYAALIEAERKLIQGP